jgi:diguanylate cyclase (GGDEF)-like protein
MSRERRAYPRRSVRWAATVTGAELPDLEVVIRDFCVGGLFLEYSDDYPSDRPVLLPPAVTLRFHDPLSGGRRRVAGRVARVIESGFGLAFPEPQPDLVAVLDSVADSQEAEHARRSGPADRLAQDAVALCREQANLFARRHFNDFCAHIADELFEKARGAASNAEQTAYFSAFRRLKDRGDPLTADFVDAWDQRLARMDQASASAAEAAGLASNPSELSLVDEQDFEDWLIRSEIISRTQIRHGKAMDALNRRLGRLIGHRLDDDNSPMAPTALCECLTQVVPVGEFDHRATQAIYEIFGHVVLNALGPLYDQINAQLRGWGVLPDIEQERPQIRPLGAGIRENPSRAAAQQESEPTRPDLPPTAASGSAAAARPATSSADASGREDANVPTEQPGRMPIASRLPGARQVLDAYRQLRARRQAAAHPEVERGHRESGGSAAPPATPAVATTQIIHALDRLTGDPAAASGSRLGEQIAESIGAPGLDALEPEARDTVEVLDDWFGDVGDNALNTDLLRDWSGRLALLALKVQLESGDFLQQQPKPIHGLINQLDRAGVALATVRPRERESLRTELDGILGTALARSREDPGALTDATDRIHELVAPLLRSRAANMQKVLQQCEGSQKLERARRAVNRELDRRIAGREIPRLLLEFIDQGWRNLLVLIRLRAGEKGDDWLRGLAVVDRLMAALGTGNRRPRPIPQPEKVLAFIDRQLTAFARYTPEMQTCMDAIRPYVVAVCNDGRAPRPLPMVRGPKTQPDGDDAARVGARWLGQAKLLKVGDWVFFAGRDGSPEPLRLQWISEEGNRYVFVNRSGVKARDLSQVELAQLLEAASAGITEDQDLPLTERQWQRRLQSMHDEMVRHATHDSLTGLLNRKAFLRELERLPTSSSGAGQPWHALVYFSIDGFKVVNGTLGHEAGDALLVELARHFEQAAGEHGKVGRLGGDEFGVLLPGVSASEAEVFAEAQCRAVGERRFVQGGSSRSISASVGALSFRSGQQAVTELLKDADEACLAAKRAGGARVHVVRADDRELQQLRTSMERAAQVDTALQGNLLELRCQRIQPIAPDSDLRPFYEVLLTIRGPDDVLIAPGDFIPAAERFGRMPAVDRWVIREVLEWCADNDDALRDIDGLTINLSGPTLNDETFVGYLREQLARTGVDGSKLCFEVTETAAVQNLARAADLITEVKTLGCRFSLDDFGSGLSSYSYLKNLPIDYLKIDGQFIVSIDEDEADHAMVRSINELGHFLGKRTIAEYVENDRILAQLREIGLDYAQGFGIGHPLPLSGMRAA